MIKVEGSTINPSDFHAFSAKEKYPVTVGIEGSGKVIKANGEAVQQWVGKRVAFISVGTGSWASYCTTPPFCVFEIDEDISLQSASSGIINPLTVLCMIERFKERKFKGMIHTAAASSLGRMVNRICQKEGIKLLNVVRRQEQAELLKS